MTTIPTRDTTAAQITERVDVARRDLVNAVAHDAGVERLTDLVNAVWSAEAIARVEFQIVTILRGFGPADSLERARALNAYFLQRLSQPPDDQWSGRRNDARRAADEAVRAYINDVRFALVGRA